MMINQVGAKLCKHNRQFCAECHMKEPEMMDSPIIPDTFPVVLYLGSEEDREELIQALMDIHPNMRSAKLPPYDKR